MWTNKFYDVMKYIAQIVLPAVGALYAALGSIWGWNYVEAIVGTISAVDLFLGTLLKIKSDQYWAAIDEGGDEDGE